MRERFINLYTLDFLKTQYLSDALAFKPSLNTTEKPLFFLFRSAERAVQASLHRHEMMAYVLWDPPA